MRVLRLHPQLAERRARDARESAQAVVTPPAARALPYGASLLRRLDLTHLAPILAREQIDAATLPFLGHPSVPPYHESTTADHSSNASCASIPYSPTNSLCAALLERLL